MLSKYCKNYYIKIIRNCDLKHWIKKKNPKLDKNSTISISKKNIYILAINFHKLLCTPTIHKLSCSTLLFLSRKAVPFHWILHETTLQKPKKPWYKVIKNSNRFFLITITHIRPISIIPEIPTFLPTQRSSLRYQTKHFRNKIFPHQSRHLRAFSHCLLALVARLWK